MSYVIHLWEHPAPLTIKQADAQHNALEGRPSPPNPKWGLLAERVEARMEELGEPLEEWPDGSPPDPGHAERTMPLLIDQQGTFLDVVVEVATSLGLTVYDDQAARAYLPFGYVIVEERSGRMTPAPPKLGTADLERVVVACERAWAPHFASLGYTMQPRAPGPLELYFERIVESGKQQIKLSFAELQDSLFFVVSASAMPTLPAPVRQAIADMSRIEVRGKELRGIAALMTDEPHAVLIKGRLRFQSHVDWLIEHLFDYYDQELGPTLDAMRDPAAIVRIACGEQDAPGYLLNGRGLLAVAWMQGDAALDKVLAVNRPEHPQWVKDWGQAACDALRKVPRGV